LNVDSVASSSSEKASRGNGPKMNFCGLKAVNVEKNDVLGMSTHLK
jgi:hypothetical protein